MSTGDGGGHGDGGATDRILRVREARREDYGTIARITVAAFRKVAGSKLSEGYAAELGDVAGRSRGSVLLVAEMGQELVGSVAYVPDPRSLLAERLRPGEAGIRMLAVAPEAQGAGIGTALVAACVQRAKSGERRAVSLYTTELMRAAHRLYRRAGFVRAPDRDWEPEPGLVLLSFMLTFSELNPE